MIEHHILEDTNLQISPMLIAKQQQLKKAKLADNLNERLSHRPGPLELIKGNILLPSNLQIGQAIKQGTIEFKPTSAGETSKYPQPSFLILKKDQNTNNVSSPNSLLNNSQKSQSPSNNSNQQQQQNKIKNCNNYHFDHHCSSLVKSNNNNSNLAINNTDLIEALGGGRPASNETSNGVISVNKVVELDENDDSNHTCSSYSSCSLNDLNDNEDNSLINNLDELDQCSLIENSLLNENNSRDSLIHSSRRNSTELQNGLNCQQSLANQTKQSNAHQPTQFTQPIHKSCTNKLLLSNSNSPLNLTTKVLTNKSKKTKIKIQNKNKIIKFHEYKVITIFSPITK